MIAFLDHHPWAVIAMLFASPTVLVVGVIGVELLTAHWHRVEMSQHAHALDELEQIWERPWPAA